MNIVKLDGNCHQGAPHSGSCRLSAAIPQACTLLSSPWTVTQPGRVSHDSCFQILCSASTGLNSLLLFLDLPESKVLGAPRPRIRALRWNWDFPSLCTFAWKAEQEHSLQGCRRCTHFLMVSSKDRHMLLVNSYSNQNVGHTPSQVHTRCW